MSTAIAVIYRGCHFHAIQDMPHLDTQTHNSTALRLLQITYPSSELRLLQVLPRTKSLTFQCRAGRKDLEHALFVLRKSPRLRFPTILHLHFALIPSTHVLSVPEMVSCTLFRPQKKRRGDTATTDITFRVSNVPRLSVSMSHNITWTMKRSGSRLSSAQLHIEGRDKLTCDLRTRSRFEKATIQRVLALASATKASQIVWCPFCKDVGQTYAANQTILICHSCERLFCCRHTYRGQPNSVPWHPKHTCEEYDKSQDDPTFRSSAQIQQARQDALDQQSRDLSRQIEISNEDWELSLTRKNDEAKLRKIEKARLERERREEEERRRRAQEKREAARKAARDAENRASEGMIQQAFVRCPFCQQPVEKISGW